MHMGKTKILTNVHGRRRSKTSHVQIGGKDVEILIAGSSTKYLGRDVSFEDYDDREIGHRIATAWGKFAQHKDILCDRHYPWRQRMRFFDAVVTPCVLYGSGSWTMTQQREATLRTA